MVRSSKRYILLAVSGGFDEDAKARLCRILEQRHGKVAVIPIKGCQANLIVKAPTQSTTEIRESLENLQIDGKKVFGLRTSGCIGKLKRLARDGAASAIAKVSQ